VDGPYEDLERRLAEYVGRPAARVWSPWPLEASSIRQFCGAVEDANPMYWDEALAAASRFGRLIAPPHALMSLAIDAWWLPADQQAELDRVKAESDEAKARAVLAEFGMRTVTVVEREEEYFAPFGPGDGRIGRERRVTAISPVKRTKVGTGVFFTYEIDYFTERADTLVARARNVTLIYEGGAA